jgi:hypothetical protein
VDSMPPSNISGQLFLLLCRNVMGTLHGHSPFSVQILLARLDGPPTHSEVWGRHFPANACCRIVLLRRRHRLQHAAGPPIDWVALSSK